MRNKTKVLLVSALSLCTLTAGVTAVAASANDTPETNAPAFTFAGTSIRLKEEAGIRFGVQMSVEDWNAYSADLAETWITISYEGKTSEKIPTSNAWYTVDGEGKYATENFVAYQSTVVLYDVPDAYFTTEFQVQAFASYKDTAKAEVTSEVFESKTMSEVAKEYAGTDAGKLESVKDYLYYTVSFENVAETQTVKHGEKATAPETTPTKTGYAFAGWDYDFSTAVTGDVTVNAKWVQAPQIIGGFYTTSAGTITANVTQAHAEAGCEGVTGTQLMPTKVSGENFIYSEVLKLQEGDNVLAKFLAAGDVTTFKLGITYFTFVDVETGATLQVQIHTQKEWGNDLPHAFVAYVYKDKDGNTLFVNGNSNGKYINLDDGYTSNYQNKTMGESVAYKKTPEITLNTTTGTISWCGVAGTTKTEESLKNFGLNGVKVTVNYYNEWYTPRGGIVIDTLCNKDI